MVRWGHNRSKEEELCGEGEEEEEFTGGLWPVFRIRKSPTNRNREGKKRRDFSFADAGLRGCGEGRPPKKAERRKLGRDMGGGRKNKCRALLSGL